MYAICPSSTSLPVIGERFGGLRLGGADRTVFQVLVPLPQEFEIKRDHKGRALWHPHGALDQAGDVNLHRAWYKSWEPERVLLSPLATSSTS